jgi:hypothetical protein
MTGACLFSGLRQSSMSHVVEPQNFAALRSGPTEKPNIVGRTGQSTIEFAFGIIIFGLILYGMVQCFRWVMMDLAERRVDHDKVLTDSSLTTEAQLNPSFHRTRKIDGVLPAME